MLRRLLAGAAALLGRLLRSLGPRRRVERFPERLADLPEDLGEFIAQREAQVPALRPGCEARVLWADPERRDPRELALVYLHGFSASRQETAPLAEELAGALGANLFEARLRGHGRDGAGLGEARVEDWLADGAEALAIGRRLGRRVVLLGCSTGATLAAWLAAHGLGGDQLAALVLISPNFGLRNPTARLLSGPWGTQLARLAFGAERSWTPLSEEHGRYWTTRYPSRLLVDLQLLIDLADERCLRAVPVPSLIFYSPRDRMVSASRIEAGARLLPRAELQALPETSDPDHHVLVGRIRSPNTLEPCRKRILEFLAQVSEG